MKDVQAIVLRAAGINCDMETDYALHLAGAHSRRVHINQLIAKPSLLDQAHILVFPGGFSYGDDVAAGKILANQLMHHLADPLYRFIEQGKLILGICNGFQVLIKTGLLPALDGRRARDVADLDATLTDNDCGCFQDRWVYLEPASPRCVFLTPGKRLFLPIAHGEGKVVAKDPATLQRISAEGYVAFRYVDAAGNRGGFPINPNGSQDDIAALTDSTGRILGMMPHPERFVHITQHPWWTRLGQRDDVGDGLSIFVNAVNYIQSHF